MCHQLMEIFMEATSFGATKMADLRDEEIECERKSRQ